MLINQNYQSHYNAVQLILPLNLSLSIPKDDPVTSFVEIMKGIDLSHYVRKLPHRGNQGYDPYMMLNIVLFAYMNQIYSLRKIQAACTHDIRFMWLANEQRPSLMAFQRFISEQLTDSIESIFYDVNHYLIQKESLDTDALFIDGTKLEANARKTSFVWKKAVLRYQEKLYLKITNIIPDINEHLHLDSFATPSYHSSQLSVWEDALLKDMERQKLVCVYGKGKRKTSLQRCYDYVKEYREKLWEYEEKLMICGERNSYSKTDHDATMMNMKYDYYNRTGVFKAGYNLQIGVSDEYVLHLGVYPNPTDTKTFIPFMKDYHRHYGKYPLYPVGDAGYGSYDNYFFCIENGMHLSMKYNYYAKVNHDKKFQKKIYHSLNWKKNNLGYKVCPQGHVFDELVCERENRSGPYLKIDRTYQCGKCLECDSKPQCSQAEGQRKLKVNPILEEMYEEVNQVLTSDQGKELRKQRSIQAEGTFGVLKEDYGYQRLQRRKKKNVKTELYLVFLGYNLKKYHDKKYRKSVS